MLDKDCLMIINGEVYLSPPLSIGLPTPLDYHHMQPSTTLYNPLETPKPLLGRSWRALGRS